MRVFGIIGDQRVIHSRSPELFNAVMQAAGIDGLYVPFPVKAEDIGEALKAIRVLHLTGVNVTVPFKEAVIAHLDILSEGAKIIGAINTISLHGEKLKGYNTNAVGFMNALASRGIDPAGKSALVFGTGGAARAVVFMLTWLKTRQVYVVGRDAAKARALVQRVGGVALPLAQLVEQPLPVDLIVNATSVTTAQESGAEWSEAVTASRLTGLQWVIDLNYGRSESLWQERAQRQAAIFMDGLPFLAAQARQSLSLWTGVEVDIGLFLEVLKSRKRE